MAKAETKTSEVRAGDRRLALEVTHDEVKALSGMGDPVTTRMTFRVRDERGMVVQKGLVLRGRGISFVKDDRTVKPGELRRALFDAGAPIDGPPKAKSKAPAPKPKPAKPAPAVDASAKDKA